MTSLYIHIPFCIKKCKYCDFVSYAGCEELFDAYIECLCNEMQQYRGERIATVFIGGGTPSLLSASQAGRLLEAVGNAFCVEPQAEFSIECNPGSLDGEKLRVYRDHGVNRISIGLQSASAAELKLLGRSHSYEQFLQAYALARRAFDNINVDLISGLPGQTRADHLRTLKEVTALAPEHLSCYSLIVAEGTPLAEELARGDLAMPPEELDREIYNDTKAYLEAHGYHRYEISNFAKPGMECRHNLQYWLRGEYIGIGCAAHSFLGGFRFCNPESLQVYMNGGRAAEKNRVTPQEAVEETLMLQLRLSAGVPLTELKKLGCDLLRERKKEIESLLKLHLIWLSQTHLGLTDEGFHVADAVILRLV